MAEAKTKATKLSVTHFLGKVSDAKRRKDCEDVVKLMKAATGEDAVMWGSSIVGFGKYHYRYESGHEGDCCVVGFSPRKSALVLYLPSLGKFKDDLERLGKHKAGKGCLYLKTLENVDRAALKSLIEKSVKATVAKRVE